jgi:hypothetical protein
VVKLFELDETPWSAWVATRPPVIQQMCAKYPPNLLYRLKTTGDRVTLVAYSENETVWVFVSGEFNLVTFERQVFGISVTDLEECDLPAESERVGCLINAPEEVEQFIAQGIAQLHREGKKHNQDACPLCQLGELKPT